MPLDRNWEKDIAAQQARGVGIEAALGGMGYAAQKQISTPPTFASIRMVLAAEINHARDIAQKLTEICEELLGTRAYEENPQAEEKPASSSILGLLEFDVNTLSVLHNQAMRSLSMLNRGLGAGEKR